MRDGTVLMIGAGALVAYLLTRKATAANRPVVDPYAKASASPADFYARQAQTIKAVRDAGSGHNQDWDYGQGYGFSSGRDANTRAIREGGAQETDYGTVGGVGGMWRRSATRR